MRAIITCIFLFLIGLNSREVTDVPPSRVEKDSVVVISRNEKIINDLHILHPAFRNKVVKMLQECEKEGIDLRIVETYRTHERQDSLKRKKLSMLSGGCSKHQHFIAIDVVPMIKGIPNWHKKELWNKIGKIGEAQGLTWGGRWRKLVDYGHFEYPIKIDSLHTLPIPDTVLIPLNY